MFAPGSELPEKYAESLRISFSEAVYGFNLGCNFEPVLFLGHEFDVMAVSGQFVYFTEIITLKTSIKIVTVALIVNYICKIKWNINYQH